jgi:MFS family permease
MTATDAEALSPTRRERIYRRNFFYFLTDNILFNVAMNIMGPTVVIPDFIRQLTNSEVLIGLSSSLFYIGWAVPQLLIARYIIRSERKKWWFIGPNIPVRFVMLIFAALVFLLGKDQPGAILAAFLVCYGIAAVGDGLVSVPWLDLIGTSLNSRWRARMFGLTAASTGVIMLGISPVIGVILGDAGPGFPNNYAVIFGAAGVLLVISNLPQLFIHELPGGKAVAATSFSKFLPDLGRVLRTDGPFRAMISTRMLTSLFMMASPFYIGFATEQLKLSSDVAVPTLLAMQTIGSILGALAYTWLGARNNLLYMRLALGSALLLPVSALIASLVGPLPLYFGFLMYGLALSNLLSSYSNWMVMYAVPDQRPIYTGLFNTVAAPISLVAPVIAGIIVQSIGYEALFAVAMVMAFSALFVTLRYVPNPRVEVIPAVDAI